MLKRTLRTLYIRMVAVALVAALNAPAIGACFGPTGAAIGATVAVLPCFGDRATWRLVARGAHR